MSLEELHERSDNPIKMRNDSTMQETIESVKMYGILTPGIVRPRAEGGYEIIAGRRRKLACEAAGPETMPVIIRELNDEQAMLVTTIDYEQATPSLSQAQWMKKQSQDGTLNEDSMVTAVVTMS